MKLNVVKLREKITRTEDALYTEYVEDRRKALERYDSELAAWREQYAPKLRQLLKDALAKLDETGVLSDSDVSSRKIAYSIGSGGYLWRSYEKRPKDLVSREDWHVPDWLTSLRSFFDAVDDDVVTSYALEKAGLLKYLARLT